MDRAKLLLFQRRKQQRRLLCELLGSQHVPSLESSLGLNQKAARVLQGSAVYGGESEVVLDTVDTTLEIALPLLDLFPGGGTRLWLQLWRFARNRGLIRINCRRGLLGFLGLGPRPTRTLHCRSRCGSWRWRFLCLDRRWRRRSGFLYDPAAWCARRFGRCLDRSPGRRVGCSCWRRNIHDPGNGLALGAATEQ